MAILEEANLLAERARHANTARTTLERSSTSMSCTSSRRWRSGVGSRLRS